MQVKYVDVFIDATDPLGFINRFIHLKNPVVLIVVGDVLLEELDYAYKEQKNIVKEWYPNPLRKIKGVTIIAAIRK